MVARKAQEEQARKRRKRLMRGLFFGAAAVGVPALANVLIARRNRRLAAPGWGRGHRYAWRHGEVAFRRLGEGPPVLLLHSFGPGHDSGEWRAVGERLSQRHEVFAPDLPGWGRSDKEPIFYDAEVYIQVVSDFLEDVVGSRATLVAAGLSASYAVQVAVDQPEAVHALALVVPTGVGLGGEEPDLKDALLHRLLKLPVLGTSTLNLLTSHAAIAHHLRREAFAAPDRVDAGLIEHHYQSCHQPGSHLALAAYLSGFLNHPCAEALRRVDCPVCLVWGRQSASPPVTAADLWLRELPTADIEVLEDSGGLPHLETADRFGRVLEAFLDRASAGPGLE